jgi:hypothetical protein|tara:strand:- start:8935 stop:9534 length:600 start_codon:yes stop_codon:yes gene_type:complete
MKKIDITREVRQMHEEKLMLKAIKEVKNELKEGVPDDLVKELKQLLSKCGEPLTKQPDNVVSFSPRSPQGKLYTFGETKLLAAAGKSLADWFSQPMSFGGAGFILDVRKIIGTENQVDVYLTPNTSNVEEMKKSLGGYLGQSIRIVVSNNQNTLLDAALYIDETGSAAEGSGKLIMQSKETAIKGNISISIVVDNKSSH